MLSMLNDSKSNRELILGINYAFTFSSSNYIIYYLIIIYDFSFNQRKLGIKKKYWLP